MKNTLENKAALVPENLAQEIVKVLDDAKGQDIASIPLAGKTSIADFLIIVTGTSDRHLGAMANRVLEHLRTLGVKGLHVEGDGCPSWLLIDTNDIIVHFFREETRKTYDLDSMWSGEFDRLAEQAKASTQKDEASN